MTEDMNKHRTFKSITHKWDNGGAITHDIKQKDCELCKEDKKKVIK